MVKLPAFMFYPGDWRKDTGVQSLSYEERGVWFELICFMWESEQRGKLVLNGKKMDENDISRLIGLDVSQTSKILATLLAKGVAKIEQNTGIIYCKRIIDEEHIRKVRAEAGYLGGSKTQAKRQSKSTPSVSYSSSNSISKHKNNISPTPQGEIENWFEVLWEKYPSKDGRKAALKSFTKTVTDEALFAKCQTALNNYLCSRRVRDGYIKNGSTWFNNWTDWINFKEVTPNDIDNDPGNAAKPVPGKYAHLSALPGSKTAV